LNKSVKTTYLIPEHPIKSKTKLRSLLQKYSMERYQGQSSFPCHRNQAKDYFKKQYLKHLNELKVLISAQTVEKENKCRLNTEKTLLTKNGCNAISEQDHMHGDIENVVKSILQRATQTKHNGKIYIQTKEFRKLLGTVTELQHNFQNSQLKINNLKSQIRKMEEGMCSYLVNNIMNQLS